MSHYLIHGPARRSRLIAALAAIAWSGLAPATEPQALIEESVKNTPAPPWPAGDERGMANAVGPGTWARCAWHLSQPQARVVEVSHVRSNTMPMSPFSGPYVQQFAATVVLPGTAHAFNNEHYAAGAQPSSQGTQIDALGHFGYLPQPWDGKPPAPVESTRYYGGFGQSDVKPSAESPLLKLGAERIPPLVTTAVLLDAKAAVGGGNAMKAGQLVTARDIESMLERQGLSKRGILPADVVLIHTGWSERWRDPDTEKSYYAMAPGLAYDAAQYLAQRRIVAIGLDTPFIDPVAEGMLAGKAPPAPGTPAGLPFAVHHHMLTQAGIHQLENMKLDEAVNQRLWTSCVMVLPLRTQGAGGSPIRPVLIGPPAAR